MNCDHALTQLEWNANRLELRGPPYLVAWPSGLRRWFKAPVSLEAWVRIPPLLSFLFSSQEAWLNTQYDIETFSFLINALLFLVYCSLIKNTTPISIINIVFQRVMFVSLLAFCTENLFCSNSFYTTVVTMVSLRHISRWQTARLLFRFLIYRGCLINLDQIWIKNLKGS